MAEFSKYFGDFYDFVLYLPDYLFLRRRRKRLLSQLSGKVLEVGFGTGMNFKHYGKSVEVVGIEPSPYMLSKAKRKLLKLNASNRFTLHNLGCCDPEMEELLEPESFDAIVCTLVLCTIPNHIRAMYNFYTWLKPGGKLLILEHVQSHNRAGSILQECINPAWTKISGGCNLNRPTDILLKGFGYKLIREEKFWLGMPFYEAELEKNRNPIALS